MSTQSQSVTLIYVDGTKGWQDINDSQVPALGATFGAATGGNTTTVYGRKVFKSISTITPSSNSAGNLTIGTEQTGRFYIKHQISKSNFTIENDPNIENIYGLKMFYQLDFVPLLQNR